MRYQCEWCLTYVDEEDSTQNIVCYECKEKAAGYDINVRDKKTLIEGVKDIIKITTDSVGGIDLRIHRIEGLAKAILISVGEKFEDKNDSGDSTK